MNKRTLTLLSLSIVAVVIGAAACIVLFFTIKNKNEHTALIIAENSAAASKDDQYKALQRVLDDTAEERELIASHIIASDGSVPFIEFLEDLANDSGVTLKIDSIAPALWNNKKNATTEALAVQVTGTGGWTGVYQFTSQLGYMPYVSRIEQMQLEKVVQDGRSYWRANVKFSVLKIK